MAELASEYLAERLSSRELLALLFVCEAHRKNTLAGLVFDGASKPPVWSEFVERFAARLQKLPESERTYLIGSHLQSAEQIDIYSNSTVQALLDDHRELLQVLRQDLEKDPRFAST